MMRILCLSSLVFVHCPSLWAPPQVTTVLTRQKSSASSHVSVKSPQLIIEMAFMLKSKDQSHKGPLIIHLHFLRFWSWHLCCYIPSHCTILLLETTCEPGKHLIVAFVVVAVDSRSRSHISVSQKGQKGFLERIHLQKVCIVWQRDLQLIVDSAHQAVAYWWARRKGRKKGSLEGIHLQKVCASLDQEICSWSKWLFKCSSDESLCLLAHWVITWTNGHQCGSLQPGSTRKLQVGCIPQLHVESWNLGPVWGCRCSQRLLSKLV